MEFGFVTWCHFMPEKSALCCSCCVSAQAVLQPPVLITVLMCGVSVMFLILIQYLSSLFMIEYFAPFTGLTCLRVMAQ